MALQPKWDARQPARRPDTFSKSDNNTIRQILAEGKKYKIQQDMLNHVERTSIFLQLS